MIDSHCHLDHEPLLNNLDEILKRSKAAGIKKLLTICTTLESFKKIKTIRYGKEISCIVTNRIKAFNQSYQDG